MKKKNNNNNNVSGLNLPNLPKDLFFFFSGIEIVPGQKRRKGQSIR